MPEEFINIAFSSSTGIYNLENRALSFSSAVSLPAALVSVLGLLNMTRLLRGMMSPVDFELDLKRSSMNW